MELSLNSKRSNAKLPTRVSGVSVFLAAALALVVAGAVMAQSQLPGTALTTDPANDLRPAWSADGTRIAFHSSRSGNNDIWVMDADGGNQRQLTDDPADDRRPAWIPDGGWIAFDSDRAGTRDIWVMDADGANPRQLTSSPAQDSFAAWSLDGSQIAFYSFDAGVMDIWVVDIQGFLQGHEAGQPHQVTTGLADEKQNQCTFACHVPAWSPDGKRIAYQGMNHSQVWVVAADGSDPHPLTDGETHDHFPWWTPDGKILFLSEHVNGHQELVNDVWEMDTDGDNKTLLFPDIPHGGPLYWSPDGSGLIAFQSPRAGNFDIYTVVLGQEVSTPQPFVATPMAAPLEVTAVPTLAPTSVATSVSGAATLPGPAVIWVVAVFAVGGGLIAFYLSRTGRT